MSHKVGDDTCFSCPHPSESVIRYNPHTSEIEGITLPDAPEREWSVAPRVTKSNPIGKSRHPRRLCRKLSDLIARKSLYDHGDRAKIVEQVSKMISFKGCQFPKQVILHAVYFYLRYSVSLRDLEEILAERGVTVDHATLNRWVVKFSPLVALEVQRRKRPTAVSWRMDETYIKVRGSWTYLYRAVDRDGKTLDFMLSERRNTVAATLFFAKALSNNGIPLRIVIDKSGANGAGIKEVNKILKRLGCATKIGTVRSKYLNNIIEQDHRFIKRRTRPMLGFKSFKSAASTLDGIEVAQMIRKKQLYSQGSGFAQFAALAG